MERHTPGACGPQQPFNVGPMTAHQVPNRTCEDEAKQAVVTQLVILSHDTFQIVLCVLRMGVRGRPRCCATSVHRATDIIDNLIIRADLFRFMRFKQSG